MVTRWRLMVSVRLAAPRARDDADQRCGPVRFPRFTHAPRSRLLAPCAPEAVRGLERTEADRSGPAQPMRSFSDGRKLFHSFK